MEERKWTQHLRMLPGGDSDITSAIIATGLLYLVLLGVGGIVAVIVTENVTFDFGPIGGFSIANSVPCVVIAAWTGFRVRSSKHIGHGEAAADLKRKRVYYGDEVARVPKSAVVFSVRPRQVTIPMADERDVTLFFRVNSDPEDLLTLGRTLRRHPGLATEDYVHQVAEKVVSELLPDPDGVKEAMTNKLLAKGIVITRAELA